jgi:hypothetical protein
VREGQNRALQCIQMAGGFEIKLDTNNMNNMIINKQTNEQTNKQTPSFEMPLCRRESNNPCITYLIVCSAKHTIRIVGEPLFLCL